MNNVRHKVLRLKGEYHIQKLFIGQNTKNYHWVAKRFKNTNSSIGPIKMFERLHQALADIREEPNGKKSKIELTDAVRGHLITIGFKHGDIDIMIDNTKETKPNEVTAIS